MIGWWWWCRLTGCEWLWLGVERSSLNRKVGGSIPSLHVFGQDAEPQIAPGGRTVLPSVRNFPIWNWYRNDDYYVHHNNWADKTKALCLFIIWVNWAFWTGILLHWANIMIYRLLFLAASAFSTVLQYSTVGSHWIFVNNIGGIKTFTHY